MNRPTLGRVGLVSLGCPKNLVDSEEMLGALAEAGWSIVADQNDADVIVVNTCGFIESAKQESIDTILEMVALKKPGGCKSVVVTGCLAQRYAAELQAEMPDIDAIVGVGQARALPGILALTLSGQRVVDTSPPSRLWVEVEERIKATSPWTAYLKISDGCDNRCSYCAIPDIRGGFRSRPLQNVIAEAQRLAAEGVLEINLVGQDVTRYGEDSGEASLVTLLRELVKIEGPKWFRLLYCYPTRIMSDLIDLVATEPKITKYMDIPFQHGDDRTLARMNRKGSSEDYLRLVKEIRSASPDIALRTSIIVGFPGETKDEFGRLVDFINEIKFDRVGVFQYSLEEGTPAAEMPGQVSERTRKSRYARLMETQQAISREKNLALIGRELDVLVECAGDEATPAYGRSHRDAPDIDGVVFLEGFCGQAGDFVRARITDAAEYDLTATVITDLDNTDKQEVV